MKITIDEEVLKEKGIPLGEALIFLAVKTGTNIPETYEKMIEEHTIIIRTNILNEETVLVSGTYDDVLMEALLDSETSDIDGTNKRLEGLAKKLIALYPKGAKPGTNIAWRSNTKDIVQRLKKFFKVYGQYDADTVYNATKQYVKSYENDMSYMRVLKYFIWKDGSRTGGGVESDLASYIESEVESTPEYQDDWTTEIR